MLQRLKWMVSFGIKGRGCGGGGAERPKPYKNPRGFAEFEEREAFGGRETRERGRERNSEKGLCGPCSSHGFLVLQCSKKFLAADENDMWMDNRDVFFFFIDQKDNRDVK